MARTEQVIYDAIITDKGTEVGLANLNSTSNTAIWRLIAWIVAKAIWFHETLFDAFKAEADAKAAAAIPGTISWYKARVMEFQYGYALSLVNYVPTYLVVDDTAKIIERVAIVESSELLIKVAKDDGAGNLTPLTAGEQTAFSGYIDQIKFAGTKTTIISLNPDLLRCTGIFYYDATYDLPTLKTALDTAVNDYLKGIDYNGFIYKQKLIDIIQAIPGFIDIDLATLEATPAAPIVYVATGRRYQPLAGYIKMNANISTLLTFTAVIDVQS